jgi:hypothetical protein
MKRILIAITMSVLVLPAIERAGAAEVSVDFFYNNLNDGNWIEVGDYGYGWQPNAASNRNWRPYADGYWAYTDVGWTWVSYEDFGWATYHYGRWARIADQGWVWFPGNDLEWGPAWVSWRTGGDYIGWAPLPPRGGQVVYEGRPITGHVDVEFDIGPAYYNFVDVRYIGEPVLRERLFESSQNVTYINKTVNVTNITYNNSVVYNYGPDYETVNRYSTRPVQRLQLERQTNVDFSVAMTSGGTKVQGQKLVVSAPLKIERSATPIAPKVVKTKVEQSKVEHGWQGLGDPKAQAQLKEKMKTEDAKNVSPPTVQPRAGAGANASAGGNVSTAASASPTTSASPAMAPIEKGKGKRKAMESNMSPSPSASVAGGAAPMEPTQGKGRKGKLAGEKSPGATPAVSATPAEPAGGMTPMEGGKGRKGKRGDQTMPGGTPAMSASPSGSTESAVPMERGRKGKHNELNAPAGMPNATVPTGSTSNAGTETSPAEPGHGKRKAERSNVNGPTSTAGATSAPNAVTAPEQHRKAQQAPSENAAGGQGQGEKGKGKKKEEVSPTPGPQ